MAGNSGFIYGLAFKLDVLQVDCTWCVRQGSGHLITCIHLLLASSTLGGSSTGRCTIRGWESSPHGTVMLLFLLGLLPFLPTPPGMLCSVKWKRIDSFALLCELKCGKDKGIVHFFFTFFTFYGKRSYQLVQEEISKQQGDDCKPLMDDCKPFTDICTLPICLPF